MSAIGLVLVGVGVLTVWAGFEKTTVFDVIRSIVGGTPNNPMLTPAARQYIQQHHILPLPSGVAPGSAQAIEFYRQHGIAINPATGEPY